MNKYTKILPFDTGSERPTIEYAEYLETANADLLGALEKILVENDEAFNSRNWELNAACRAAQETIRKHKGEGMDNQDLTFERRLEGKDEQIADLLEAMGEVVDLCDWQIEDSHYKSPEQMTIGLYFGYLERLTSKIMVLKEAIRKHKGK